MKKYIILALSLLMVISMVACGDGTSSTIKPPVIKPDNSELIKKIDAEIEDMIGEYVLTTNYEDDTYSIVVTCNGIKKSVGSDVFDDVCSSFDDVTIAINEDHGIDCLVFIVSDKDYSEVLYATLNGNDVTDRVE